jgi:hypothetical protein
MAGLTQVKLIIALRKEPAPEANLGAPAAAGQGRAGVDKTGRGELGPWN